MAYTEDIVRPLIETLSKTAGLPRFRLAGHVPNLAFWMAEVRHALDVIEGYPKRFEQLVTAQNEFDANYRDAAKRRKRHEYKYDPPRLALTPAQAGRLRRELVTVANRVLGRCLKEELIDIVKADDLRPSAHPVEPLSPDDGAVLARRRFWDAVRSAQRRRSEAFRKVVAQIKSDPQAARELVAASADPSFRSEAEQERLMLYANYFVNLVLDEPEGR